MLTKPRTSPQKAIAAHCKDCIYDLQCSGNWREQVEACTIEKCALYEHRPVTAKTQKLRRESYLASLTPEQRAKIELTAQKSSERLVNIRLKQNGKGVDNAT